MKGGHDPASSVNGEGTWLIPGWLIVSVLALSAGCALRDRPADLVIINGPEPESLDPAVQTGQADGRLTMAIFEGLTRYDPTNATPIPGLAQHWDESTDGRGYTFYLRT